MEGELNTDFWEKNHQIRLTPPPLPPPPKKKIFFFLLLPPSLIIQSNKGCEKGTFWNICAGYSINLRNNQAEDQSVSCIKKRVCNKVSHFLAKVFVYTNITFELQFH